MKSSTEIHQAEQPLLAKWQEPNWNDLLGEQARDLEELAKQSGAMLRQRKVQGAMALLRMILAYAVCDWSLRMVCLWATLQGITCISDVAFLYRLRQSPQWLGKLVVKVLQQRNAELQRMEKLHVRLVDATVISQPGSKGTDWRVHASFDLGQMCLDGLEVTDAHGGERLTRFVPRDTEIYIADRGYGLRNNLLYLLRQAARFVVRIGWNQIQLHTEGGQRLDLIHLLKRVETACEHTVYLSDQPHTPVRLIVSPLSPEHAQQARERVARQAKKKGKTVNPNTYLAAGFVLLLTNLPAAPWEIHRLLWLYRLRWQIELQFKRLKSLLHIDHLRAQDPALVQTYLFAKLLAALLLDQLVQRTQQQHPDWFASLQRPVSLWRLQALLWAGIRDLIVGRLSLFRILQALPTLHRYLCDPPRLRNQQLAWARSILSRLQAV